MLALTMCLGAPPTANAAPTELRVLVADQPTPAAREKLAALIKRFPSTTVDTDARRLVARPGAAVHVALGADALKALLEAATNSPLLALLSSSESFRATVAEASAERRRAPLSAIYAEAAPAQQMMLIRLIFRRPVRVGVLLTENTAHIEPLIRSAARSVD
jgi:hypothetical protein